ncbi:MAG TPA: GNAT family N-acetyltransferase, partial [Chitinophagaceae bacterium]
YMQDKGNFWLMLDKGQVVGTIALIDIGNAEAVLRKMFVHPAYRGSQMGVAQVLLETLLNWCRANGINTIFLGTIDIMKAAHRFYEKNGFVKMDKVKLPSKFPAMKVDNVFYKYTFTRST